jgi:hypothetical protein
MAIVIGSQSKCSVCGKLLDEIDEVEMFPSFVSNVNDPLFIFSDRGVHVSCLNTHILVDEIRYYRDEFYNSLQDEIFDVSGRTIANPRNLVAVGLLTSDKGEELYKYNFLKIDKGNIPYWKDRRHFLSVATDYLHEGNWKSFGEFNLLEYLVEIIAC